MLLIIAAMVPLSVLAHQRPARRLNRACYDAGKTIAGFAAALKDTVNLDSVREDLAIVPLKAVALKALEPAHLSVWVK
jgi:hypothetical protein